MNNVFKWLLVTSVVFLCIYCSRKEDKLSKDLIQGTWKGIVSYKQIKEIHVYAPLIEDSLTKLIDSTIFIENVLMDAGKENVRFYGFKEMSSMAYSYSWNGAHLDFQKKILDSIPLESEVIITAKAFSNVPSGNILKLDADSLVVQLNVYTDRWNEYLFKAKRK